MTYAQIVARREVLARQRDRAQCVRLILMRVCRLLSID